MLKWVQGRLHITVTGTKARDKANESTSNDDGEAGVVSMNRGRHRGRGRGGVLYKNEERDGAEAGVIGSVQCIRSVLEDVEGGLKETSSNNNHGTMRHNHSDNDQKKKKTSNSVNNGGDSDFHMVECWVPVAVGLVQSYGKSVQPTTQEQSTPTTVTVTASVPST